MVQTDPQQTKPGHAGQCSDKSGELHNLLINHLINSVKSMKLRYAVIQWQRA